MRHAGVPLPRAFVPGPSLLHMPPAHGLGGTREAEGAALAPPNQRRPGMIIGLLLLDHVCCCSITSDDEQVVGLTMSTHDWKNEGRMITSEGSGFIDDRQEP